GVSKLRTHYGGKKNRGYKPERFYKGSGSIVRKIIQQLEKEGFVKTDLKSQHKGRLITAKGKKFLDDVASKIASVKPQIKESKKEEKTKAAKEQKEQKPAQENKAAEQKAQAEIKAAKEKPQERAAEAQ
ncbi:MAG: 40S ribosomal protein S19, partial [Nanoarchaeota archaeon]